MTGLAALAILATLTSGGCTPSRFRMQPYRDNATAAQRLALRARQACAALRGERDLPPHPFTTDGCSAAPDGDWVDCCVEHDLAYWCGGGAAARRLADRRLQRCIVAKGHSPLAGWMAYAATRTGGAPWTGLPWRWGYGWDPGRCYDRRGPAVDRCAAWCNDGDPAADH